MFQARKRVLANKSSTGIRYWKNVGLGFRTPKEAMEGQHSPHHMPHYVLLLHACCPLHWSLHDPSFAPCSTSISSVAHFSPSPCSPPLTNLLVSLSLSPLPFHSPTGTYVDKKCPFTSSVSIRGRILKGYIHSAKMNRTIIVRRDYLHFIRKYQRYEKRHKNVAAHVSPCFRVKEGDMVTIGECRPLSKTVRFNVLKVDSVGGGGKGVKLFAKF